MREKEREAASASSVISFLQYSDSLDVNLTGLISSNLGSLASFDAECLRFVGVNSNNC